MYQCSECGATAPTVEEHVCPVARGPRMPVASSQGSVTDASNLLTAPEQRTGPSLLDILSMDEDKLDRVIGKLEKIQQIGDSGALEKLERLAALQEKLKL